MAGAKGAITIDDLEVSYSEFKKQAVRYYDSGQYENSLILIEGCARLAYEFNFIQNFCDDELEDLLICLSEKLFVADNSLTPKAGRVIFYDYFAISNRGLTQQYLDALIALNYEIIFIVSNDYWYSSSADIIKQVKDYKHGRIIIFSRDISNEERIKRLSNAVESLCPEFIFLHLSPWDVIANSVFPRYNFAKRVFINITDHAFWLGKKCIDICLEFRQYGYQLTTELRGVDSEKLFYLPYYPVTQPDSSFRGFGINVENRVVGISGGTGYKFIGDNWRFFNLIHSLIKAHNNFIFFLVGLSGSAKDAFKQKIKEAGVEDKFILLNDRYDIYQLIKHADIFFGSYPFPGALMTQLASQAEKPIVTYTSDEFIFSFIDDIMPFINGHREIVKTDDDYLHLCSRLITDKEFRNQYASVTAKCTIDKEVFVTTLQTILNGGRDDKFKQVGQFDLSNLSYLMSKWHLEIENLVYKNYHERFMIYVDQLPEESFLRSKYPRSGVPPKIVVKTLIRKVVPRFIINKASNHRKQHLIRQTFKNGQPLHSIPEPNRIINPQFISIGSNFACLTNLRLEALDFYLGERFHPEIFIGDNVQINTDCHIGGINKICIGNNVLIASRVFISDHSHGQIDKDVLKVPPSKRQLFSKGPVVIEDNVWIGEGVCIMPGVTVGKNSIIGANSVVTKDIPKNVVVAGIPARIIKELF